jgi:hypothetical protein
MELGIVTTIGFVLFPIVNEKKVKGIVLRIANSMMI